MCSCLVTTLKAAVDDDNLPRMGDVILTLSEPNGNKSAFQADANPDGEWTCISVGGDILDASGNSLGNRHAYTGRQMVYLDPNVTKVILRAGYKFVRFYRSTFASRTIYGWDRYHKFHPEITQFFIGKVWATDIGDVTPEEIVKALPNAVELSIRYKETPYDLTLDLSKVNFNAKLTALYIDDICIKGSLATIPKGCNELHCYGNDGEVTDVDIPALGFTLPRYMHFDGFHTTWESEMKANLVPFNIVAKLGDYVDACLNNFAKGTSPFPLSYILLTGTRTSASDAAVATLQNKGCTITITPES